MTHRTTRPIGLFDQSKPADQIASAEAQIVEQSKRIDFYLTEYTVEILVKKLAEGDFEIPSYQREFTWEPRRQSRFVESLLIGLPIPFLIFWQNPDSGNLEIVDGSQRLRTLRAFLENRLVLDDLDQLSSLNGFKYSDFPESRQKKIKNQSIRGIILNDRADAQSRFDVFERINTGSKHANMAEIRRGAIGGPFLDLVIALSSGDEFKALAPVTNKAEAEREREELVTRFFAYSDGLEGYRDRPAEFIFDYVKKMNERFAGDPGLVRIYQDRFLKMLEAVGTFSPSGFRKTPTSNTTPRTRFEALAIGTYLALEVKPDLDFRSVDTSWLTADEFLSVSSSGGANGKQTLIARTEYVKNKLLG